MDGFDDLLGPSRNALEDNPFSDPFGKRSSSPDPWASPFGQHQDDIYHQPFASDTPTTPTTTDHSSDGDEHEDSSTPVQEEPSDPLDSAAANIPDPEEEQRPALPRQRSSTTSTHIAADASPPSPSPGFRESIPSPEPRPAPDTTKVHEPTSFSETATIRPTEPEETIPATTHESSPPSTSTPPAWGPLDRNNDRGFGTGLALGGEAVNDGWRGESENWSSDRTMSRFPTEIDADEDSDDDKPIGRLKSPERVRMSRVSLTDIDVV